jgi:hypothetical protein
MNGDKLAEFYLAVLIFALATGLIMVLDSAKVGR